MIVFTSTLRIARRPRRVPSVASVVRALGTVRITDQPVDETSSSGSASHLAYDLGNQPRAGWRSAGTPST